MTQHQDDLTDDESLVLAAFAGFMTEDDIPGLAKYLTHCGIQISAGANVADTILAHYRTPLGYDIERVAMDLRTSPPVAARILELQNAEAERRTAIETQSRRQRRKRSTMNGHTVGHPI